MAIRLLYLTRWITAALAGVLGILGVVLAITEPTESAGWILIGIAVLRISAQKAISAEARKVGRASGDAADD